MVRRSSPVPRAYVAYMTSAAWFSRRRWWLAEHRRRTGTAAVCAVCGDPDIDLHHLEYTFGRERYEDLLPLCHVHHSRIHAAWDATPHLRRLGRRAASILLTIRMRSSRQAGQRD
jgi:hypothetical protein